MPVVDESFAADDGDELGGGAGRGERRDEVRLARSRAGAAGAAERDREGGEGGEKAG